MTTIQVLEFPQSAKAPFSCIASNPMAETRWYCLRAATRQEKRALQSLSEAGIEAYMPRETRWKDPIRKEGEKIQAPLFPGYLFARLTDEDFDRLRDENNHYLEGIHGWLKTGSGAPLVIRFSAIAWCVWLEGTGEFDWTWTPKKERWKPKKGDCARITKGPWVGFMGPVTELRNKNRAAVLLTLFGRTKAYDIPIVDLEAVA